MEYLSVYTRAQALDDGVLVDVTELSKEARIRYPVALTKALYEEVFVPSEADERLGQSVTGRLWDALTLFAWYARRINGHTFQYPLRVQRGHRAVDVLLKAVIGPGDDLEPVITLLLPHED
ncbi:DUF6573 family protein [Alicyclobacillus sp. SP_1]|uniref:DUF6573 family protein n=1 Tax=Alicyclobacillus sp. SP_1 TaxID=2942475 RepID=UPI0021580B6D|nr:DUF6573 family protein [Alicyclobacillus sp. SP_1]